MRVKDDGGEVDVELDSCADRDHVHCASPDGSYIPMEDRPLGAHR